MDQPLFGEQKPQPLGGRPRSAKRPPAQSRVAMFAIGGILGALLLFSIIVSIVFGFQTYKQNLLFPILLVLLAVLTFILFRWYQNQDLDPKFRFFIVGMIIATLFAAIVANAFAWMGPPPSSKCANGEGLYLYNEKTCVTVSGGLAGCQAYGMCLCFSQWPTMQDGQLVGSAFCGNCTLCQGVAPPPKALPPPVAAKAPGTAQFYAAGKKVEAQFN